LYYESIFVHGGLLKVPRCVRKNIFFILSSAEIRAIHLLLFRQNYFHEKPLQSSWKGQAAWGITLETQRWIKWLELVIALTEHCFERLDYPVNDRKSTTHGRLK